MYTESSYVLNLTKHILKSFTDMALELFKLSYFL